MKYLGGLCECVTNISELLIKNPRQVIVRKIKDESLRVQKQNLLEFDKQERWFKTVFLGWITCWFL